MPVKVMPGWAIAIVCIFNADTIIDHADFVDSSLANEGLEYVLVDGKVVLEQGKYNNTRVAKVYLKGQKNN